VDEFNKFFKNVIKKVNKIVIKKSTKYPMLDIGKIRTFLLTWTKHFMKKDKDNIINAFYKAIITFETVCNLAKQKLSEG
jgi:hypothetical protein